MQVSSDKTLDLHWMHHQTQWRMPYSKLFSYSQKRRWVDKMFMHWKVDFLDKLLIPLGWKLLTVLPRYLYKSLGHYSWKLFEFRQILHTLNTTFIHYQKPVCKNINFCWNISSTSNWIYHNCHPFNIEKSICLFLLNIFFNLIWKNQFQQRKDVYLLWYWTL